MPVFEVKIKEIHYTIALVKAKTEEEAKNLAKESNEVDDLEVEYSHTAEMSEWIVTKLKKVRKWYHFDGSIFSKNKTKE